MLLTCTFEVLCMCVQFFMYTLSAPADTPIEVTMDVCLFVLGSCLRASIPFQDDTVYEFDVNCDSEWCEDDHVSYEAKAKVRFIHP